MNLLGRQRRKSVHAQAAVHPYAEQFGTIAMTLPGLLILTFSIGRLMPADPDERLRCSLLTAAFAPLIATQPYAQNLANTLRAPGSDHLFGIDELEGDIFIRLICGARLTLTIILLVSPQPEWGALNATGHRYISYPSVDE